MGESTSYEAESPQLCANGCGFFGSSAIRNLCSKCYEGYLMKELISIKKSMSDAASNAVLVKEKRCLCCKKRVGFIGFECRCGGLFCGMHRYPETHSCSFDYKKAGRLALAKQNPLCVGDKLEYRI